MYTIKGKDYSEFDINKRCAELMGIKYDTNDVYVMIPDDVMSIETGNDELIEYAPCHSPSDTWPIIEKCWDELIFADYRREVNWDALMEEHKCTKLAAACICFIESNLFNSFTKHKTN